MQQDLDSAELPYHVNVNEMTDDEKNLYYFKLHDSDNNDALDGLELIQAATHHAHDKHLPDEKTDEDPQSISEELTHIIGNIAVCLMKCKYMTLELKNSRYHRRFHYICRLQP